MICRNCSHVIEPCTCRQANPKHSKCPWYGYRHIANLSHFCHFPGTRYYEMAEPDPEFHTIERVG